MSPIYEWSCPICGREFETKMTFKEADEQGKRCECGADCKRLISNCSFTLRGEGWPSKDIRRGID